MITTPPPVPRAVLIWLVIALGIGLMFFTLVTTVFAGHLAPGCLNQHFRPRISQCCPRYLYGDPLPPQCLQWDISGHLAQCCGAEPDPTPTPAECLWLGTCPSPSPTVTGICAEPTPLPTPVSHLKGECCREVRGIYKVARKAIVDRKTAELKALVAWKLSEMKECREGY